MAAACSKQRGSAVGILVHRLADVAQHRFRHGAVIRFVPGHDGVPQGRKRVLDHLGFVREAQALLQRLPVLAAALMVVEGQVQTEQGEFIS